MQVMNVVIYTRVSQVKQDTISQENTLLSYAAKKGWTVKKQFTEKISGTKTQKDRPALSECIDFCISNNIDFVLIWELSRLGRSTIDVLQTIDTFHKNQICIFIKQFDMYSLDCNGKQNAASQLFFTLLSSFAELELNTTKDRLQRGRKDYIERGGKVGRKPGYKLSNKDLLNKYPGAVKLLKKGTPIRHIATLEGIAPKTVLTVKKALLLE
jgi:DNA invertase Pin-like site-specific DNA recombinase